MIKYREIRPTMCPKPINNLKKLCPGALQKGSWEKVGSKSGILERHPNFLADLGDPQNPRGRQKPYQKIQYGDLLAPLGGQKAKKRRFGRCLEKI